MVANCDINLCCRGQLLPTCLGCCRGTASCHCAVPLLLVAPGVYGPFTRVLVGVCCAPVVAIALKPWPGPVHL
eukprot:9295649-Lingulodinium_polyedra.AAC.1